MKYRPSDYEIDLSNILRRLGELEARVIELEKNSHAPVNLLPIIKQEVANAIATNPAQI